MHFERTFEHKSTVKYILRVTFHNDLNNLLLFEARTQSHNYLVGFPQPIVGAFV